MVINIALPLLENWEVRKAYKRDILLALALAYCSKARDLLTNEQVGRAPCAGAANCCHSRGWASGQDGFGARSRTCGMSLALPSGACPCTQVGAVLQFPRHLCRITHASVGTAH